MPKEKSRQSRVSALPTPTVNEKSRTRYEVKDCPFLENFEFKIIYSLCNNSQKMVMQRKCFKQQKSHGSDVKQRHPPIQQTVSFIVVLCL